MICGTDIFKTGWGADHFSIGDKDKTKGWVNIDDGCQKMLGFMPEKSK